MPSEGADAIVTLPPTPVSRFSLRDIAQIVQDPHVLERELIADYPDPDMGAFPMHHVVPRFSGTPGAIGLAASQGHGARAGESLRSLAIASGAMASPNRGRLKPSSGPTTGPSR